MSGNSEYLHLSTLTMDACDMTKESYAEARRTWLCAGCCTPKPAFREIDAWLQDVPGAKPLNFVGGCRLGVVHQSLLDKFDPEIIRRDLCLGKVHGPDGKLIADWVTFRGRRRVIVRGTKNAGSRKCSECGRDVYFAMGDSYLYPEPPGDAQLFESDKVGLLIAPDLAAQVTIEKRPRLDIEWLPVLETPTDGLGKLYC